MTDIFAVYLLFKPVPHACCDHTHFTGKGWPQVTMFSIKHIEVLRRSLSVVKLSKKNGDFV